MLYFGVFKASEMFFFHKRSNIAIEVVFCYPKNGKLWEPKSKHVAKVHIDHSLRLIYTKLNSAR